VGEEEASHPPSLSEPLSSTTEDRLAKRVLVVDDDKSLTQFLQDFFSQEGHQMLTALDGPSAIEAVRRHQPDLVLLDMKLPGLDGVGVLKVIRQERPATQVIVVTSYDEDYKRICEGLGVEGFFAKPIGLMQLSTRIMELLHNQADPPPALAGAETETLIPQAKLLLVGQCAIMPVKLCIPDRESLDSRADELDRAIGVGRYESADAHSVKEVREQLRRFRPDLVLISTDFRDEHVSPPATAATVASEILQSPSKPKDLIVFGRLDALADPQGKTPADFSKTQPVEVPGFHEWASPEYLRKATRFSRLLRETCFRLGLVVKKAP